MPAIANVAAALRPDLAVHAPCENAGTAKDHFPVAMGAALGLDEDTTQTLILAPAAAGRTALPRTRVLLSTWPC
eukprot:11176740-Lingulodinium_polyedra.AAC.1